MCKWWFFQNTNSMWMSHGWESSTHVTQILILNSNLQVHIPKQRAAIVCFINKSFTTTCSSMDRSRSTHIPAHAGAAVLHSAWWVVTGRQRPDTNYWWNESEASASTEVAGSLVRCSAPGAAPPLGALCSRLSGRLVGLSASVINTLLMNAQSWKVPASLLSTDPPTGSLFDVVLVSTFILTFTACFDGFLVLSCNCITPSPGCWSLSGRESIQQRKLFSNCLVCSTQTTKKSFWEDLWNVLTWFNCCVFS